MTSPGPSEATVAPEAAERWEEPYFGLTQQEAERRLNEEGYNELPSAQRQSIFALALGLLKEPMLLLLVAAATIYLFLGDIREALILLASVVVVIGISLYQEQRSERALDALRDLSSPRSLVIR
ncbi:MAG TPA: cation-transporting P-type ATPase, partial [Ktedonobacterales bacterium]